MTKIRATRAGRMVVAVTLSAAMAMTLPMGAEARAPDSFADLAERLTPAVVNISTSQTVEQPQGQMPPQLPPGTPFEDLFRDFFDRQQPQGPRQVQSLGSGFVVSAEGYVVTNNHVIEGADDITVNFADGSSHSAELIGTDPKTDIAVLKIDAEKPLPFVKFGDSDAIRVGDWVLAIGNPFGLGGSVSAGIVSARNRDINAGPYDDFIQTDAAINRGNSGGPLFNMEGDVVGVNTAIYSPTGGSVGIGFSVPSNIVQSVVSQLREFGETRRGWLGVQIQTVTDEIAEAIGLDKASGALVSGVSPDGPAAAAGIKSGDVILSFDGRDVPDMRDLPAMVANTQVGKTVRVVVYRDGKTQTLKVELGRLEEQAAATSAPEEGAEEAPAPDVTQLPELGLSLAPLTDPTRTQFGIPEDVTGVLVREVEPGSVAAERGITPGDIITEVQQQPVSSAAEIEARIAEARDKGRKSALFLVQSGQGSPRFIPLPIAGAE